MNSRRPHSTSNLFAGRLAAYMAVAVVLVAPGPAISEDNPAESRIEKDRSERSMLLQADQLLFDNTTKQIIAKGNVEIYYKDYALSADNLTYSQNANTLDAVGNVRVKEPDGAVVNADRITLTDEFREGFIQSLPEIPLNFWQRPSTPGGVFVYEHPIIPRHDKTR